MAVLQVGKMGKKLGMPNKEKSEGPLKGRGQATELFLRSGPFGHPLLSPSKVPHIALR